MNNFDVARIRTNYPSSVVVKNSTPVLFFGNILDARIATLGINPSKNEFLDQTGTLLNGNNSRLETLVSLNVKSLNNLNIQQGHKIYNGCLNYFSKCPYKKWFNQLENHILTKSRLKVSYFNGTACHLDLVQWATDPIWRSVNNQLQNQLLKNDTSYLNSQLSNYPIEVLLINGIGGLNYFKNYYSSALSLIRNTTLRTDDLSTNVYEYDLSLQSKIIKVYAWSSNLQSTKGLTNQMKGLIAGWI